MYNLGIDLGGTNIKVGLCTSDGKLVKKMSVPTGKDSTATDIVDAMVKLCYDLIGALGIEVEDIDSLGVAAPGTVDLEKGDVVFCNNLPFLYYPLAKELSRRIPITRIYLENDANAAALGEVMCGGAKGAKNAIIVTLGTGVGSGIVIDGKIYSGFNFAGGELGHMVIELNGRPCTCGRNGCLEAYASATGFIKTTKELMDKNPDSKMWDVAAANNGVVDGQTAFRAADMGDAAAKEAVGLFIEQLSSGIINIINIFQPEVLCIGGGLSNEGDNLFKPLMANVEKEQYSRYCSKTTDIRMATLGNDAGIVGAAMLGCQLQY